jgi:PAS domain-containing protein
MKRDPALKQDLEATQLLPRPVWENPRIQLLDDIWLLTIVAVVVAVAVPWFVSGFDIDAGPASWGLLALGGVHVAFTMLASPAQHVDRRRTHVLTLLDMAGVLSLGFLWRHVGAVQNPMFLTVFALPVLGSIFLSRWHPFLLAAVSVLVVAAVAFVRMPEMRWYLGGLIGGDRLSDWLPANQREVAQAAFAGFYAPLRYQLVLLEVFTILLFACAVAAEYLAAIFERLNANVLLARLDAEQARRMWANLIERLPLPALLVDPFTMRIDSCSDAASTYLEAGDLGLEGRNFLDALQFSYPDVMQDLVNGEGGESAASVIRIGQQLRVTRVRVMHVAFRDRRFALVIIEDLTEVFCLKTALDGSEYAALVIDSRGRVLAFNTLAAGLFGAVTVGGDAAQLLAQPDAALRWWDPGLTGRRKMHIQIGPRIYQITSSAVALAGEAERIYTVALLPVANAGGYDPTAGGTTIVTNILGRLG